MQFREHYKCVGEKGINTVLADEIWKKITEEEVFKFVFDDGGND